MYNNILYFLPLVGLLILIFTSWRSNWIKKQDAGDEKMVEIAQYISKGAVSFLKAAYKSIISFALVTCLLLLGMSYLPHSHTHPIIAIPF